MLTSDILLKVNKPARYTGGEWNCIIKDWESTPVKIALAYPDTYEIGMSNLAIPILYDILNRRKDTLAERVYAPWVDMEEFMRRRNIPLFSLESKKPLAEFDIIGFSLGYELTYTNVLNMLDLAGIPVLAAARGESYPLIIAGGSGALNPEPLADFVDAFVIGDGEEVVLEFIDAFLAHRGQGKSSLLRKLATIPGVYVPRLYEVTYDGEGLIKGITPTTSEAPPKVRRRIVRKLPPPPTRPVVPYIEVVHDRGMIEIQRGCSRGCRFCQAGIIYRPVRERTHGEVVSACGELITNCGYEEIALVSLNTSDYTGIEALIAELKRRYPDLALSLPSLRLDKSSVNLVKSLPTRQRSGLTFAPEAGSERLRAAINKALSEASFVETVITALERGWSALKLYFMVGLPTETAEDVAGIARLIEKASTESKKACGKRPVIRVSISTFVPKPHTPFQWSPQEDEASLAAKQELLRKSLSRKDTRLSWQDPKTSLLEAVLSRGDRRLGRAIYHAWKLGCRFDAWSEQLNFSAWTKAFAAAALEPAFYAHRTRALDEVLPWSHIDSGVTEDFLRREFANALKGAETPDCRTHSCQGCGLENSSVCRAKKASIA